MHVAPADFRAVRRDGVLLRFAILDEIAFIQAQFPRSGSRGTFAEEPCELPHWGFTVAGEVTLELEGAARAIPQGSAFHVPAGVPHRFVIDGPARLAGFDRVPPGAPTTDQGLRSAGYEVVHGAGGADGRAVSIVSAAPELPPTDGEVAATARRMGDVVFTRVRLGRRAGYVSLPCDASHWGLVTSGSLAIEWEDSIEVVGAGDVFYCPPGPPGHRLEAAEPAVVVDFTPVEALDGRRIAEWRVQPMQDALREPSVAPDLDVAALV